MFFVLSGYFIVRSFDSGKYAEGGSLAYVKARIKRIYLYYIIAFVVLFMVQYVAQWKGEVVLKEAIKHSLPEIFLIQNIGIFNGGINYPLWQMCTLIVGSYLLFGMLMWKRNFVIRVICPILAILTYTYLENVYGDHIVAIWEVQYGFFYVPLLKAIGSLALGMALYELINCIVIKSETWKMGHLIITGLSLIMLVFYRWNNGNAQAIIAFVGLMICCLSSKGIVSWLFNRKCFKIAEKLSLSIYLNHAMIILLFGYQEISFQEDLGLIVIYIFVVIGYSYAFIKIVDGVQMLVKSRRAGATYSGNSEPH